MEFLRITSAAGVQTYIPKDALLQVTVAADVVGAATANASGRRQRGLLTDLKYLDGIAAASPSITVVAAIAVWNGANTLYEVGCQSVDGAFVAILSNRAVNY